MMKNTEAPMTSFALKSIAVFAMVLDHIGFYLHGDILWKIFRTAGRISMPIFAFFIAEGFCKTASKGRYASRLLVFAFISEIPFDMYFFRSYVYTGAQNIFFTLFLSLIAIWAWDIVLKKTGCFIWASIPVFVLCCAACILKTDYDWQCIVLCLAFYVFPQTKKKNAVCHFLAADLPVLYDICAANTFFNRISLIRGAAVLPLMAYNGKKTNIKSKAAVCAAKWFFYLFYPIHLLILRAVML